MIITFFKSEHETYMPSDMSVDLDWNEIVAVLTTFNKVPVKEHTHMYNLWEFQVKENQIHRCKEDCIALHGLVLDYDKNITLEKAVEQFTGFECVIYTTFNHRHLENERFRIVVPFTKPMPISVFDRKRAAMIDSFPGVDRASFTRSQAIFLHSGPDEANAFSAHMQGEFLDWEVFEDEEIIEYKPQPTNAVTTLTPQQQQSYRAEIIKSLYTCRDFRHINALNIVIILKSCGATFADYCAIVDACGHAGSVIRENRSKNDAWAAVPNDVKIGKQKRDKFIKQFGGQVPFTATKKPTFVRSNDITVTMPWLKQK